MKKSTKIIISLSVLIMVLFISACALRSANQKYMYSTYPLKYEAEVNAASEKYDIDKALIYAVIKTESDFDPNAESGAGALGLMQFVPNTFEWLQTYYKEENDYTFEDLRNPEISIDYGTHLLSILFNMYETEDTVLCAYNGGLGNVDEWLSNPEYSDDGIHLKEVPFPETDNYRKKVARNKSIYNELYFGK